jgi:WD40 repeat protein
MLQKEPNTVHSFNEHGKAAIATVAFSKDGALLITLGLNSKVNIWELAKRKLRTTLHAPPATMYWALTVSPDNKMLATSSDKGAVYLWDLASAKKLKEWQFPFQTKQVAFAPDTRHLAVALGNGTVYILRLAKMPDRVEP